MTQNSPAVLIQGSQLSASLATYYTVPALTKTRINQLICVNTDTIVHQVSVYISPNSSVATAADIVATINLAPGQSYSVYQAINQVMASGGTIQAIADAVTSVTIKASGTLIQ